MKLWRYILCLILALPLCISSVSAPPILFPKVVAQGGGDSDPYFASVVLLAHMNGTDASTVFTDSSSYARTITAFGNAQIDTAQSKFGGASGLFDGASDSITCADSSDFTFGTGAFTFEFWVRLNSGSRVWLFDDFSNGYFFGFTGSSGRIEVTCAGTIIDSGSTAFNNGQWYHIALVRNGTSWKVYRDGVLYVSATSSNSWGSNKMVINRAGSTVELNGWLDDLRVTKGVARYTANFTLPAAQFPDQ